ncbi:MAG TPA: hypothetical protein VNL96_01265 [Gemmatimonadaceae bacterium]|nr:hypothetical protein [Gemmatimonadaceae bacterium]
MNAIPAAGPSAALSAGEQAPASDTASGVDFVALLQLFLAGVPAPKAPSGIRPTALTGADSQPPSEEVSSGTGDVPATSGGGIAELGSQTREGSVAAEELMVSSSEQDSPPAWRREEQVLAAPLSATIAAPPRDDGSGGLSASTNTAFAAVDARDILPDAGWDEPLEESAIRLQPPTVEVQVSAVLPAMVSPSTVHAREGAAGGENTAEVPASSGNDAREVRRADPTGAPRGELVAPRQPKSLGVPLEPGSGHSLALRAAIGEALALELAPEPSTAPELAATGDRWTPTTRAEPWKQSADLEQPEASRGSLRSGSALDAQVLALKISGKSPGNNSDSGQGNGTSTTRRAVMDHHSGRSSAESDPDVVKSATSDGTSQGTHVVGVPEPRTSLPDGIAKPALARAITLSEAPSGVASQDPQLQQQITLRLDDGSAARLRITVRGDRVEALIVEPDSLAAGRLFGRVEELRAALQRSGFSDPIVVVRAPSRASDVHSSMTVPNDVVALRTSEGQQARDSRSSSFSYRRQDEGGSQGQGRSHQRSGRERER